MEVRGERGEARGEDNGLRFKEGLGKTWVANNLQRRDEPGDALNVIAAGMTLTVQGPYRTNQSRGQWVLSALNRSHSESDMAIGAKLE